MKIFEIEASFRHTVNFIVKASNEEAAEKLVKKVQFGHHPRVEFQDGNFAELLSID